MKYKEVQSQDGVFKGSSFPCSLRESLDLNGLDCGV